MPMKKRIRPPAKAAARAGRRVVSGSPPAEKRHTATIRRLRAKLAAALKRIDELQASADTDFLLDIPNRRGFEHELSRAVAYIKRYRASGALILLDVDRLKPINDAFGHAAGDEVLKEFAAALRATVRESDVAGRWGGEEFALVLTGTDADGGVRLAERARVAIESRTVVLPEGDEVTVTASFGVAAFPDQREPGELLAAADAALFEAKRTGKTKVVRALESSPEEMV